MTLKHDSKVTFLDWLSECARFTAQDLIKGDKEINYEKFISFFHAKPSGREISGGFEAKKGGEHVRLILTTQGGNVALRRDKKTKIFTDVRYKKLENLPRREKRQSERTMMKDDVIDEF